MISVYRKNSCLEGAQHRSNKYKIRNLWYEDDLFSTCTLELVAIFCHSVHAVRWDKLRLISSRKP